MPVTPQQLPVKALSEKRVWALGVRKGKTNMNYK